MSAGEYLATLSEEGRYRLLVDAITDYAVYMLDQHGYVSSWNVGAQRFKGYTANEIIGQHFSKFYTPEDREKHAPEKALETARTEGRFEAEGWRLRKDGTRFWTHVVIDPIRSPEGELLGYAKITRDLTERLEAQRQIEISRQALFQAQKLEAIGQLTGGIAHDFNNLLMAIQSSLQLLHKRLPDDARAHALLDNAMQGVHRGTGLTQRMLAFARRQQFDPQATNLAQTALSMADLFQRSIEPTIDISFEFPGDLPDSISDPNQFETALLNLVLNARDAMPTGGRITLSAQVEKLGLANALDIEAGDYVCFAVEDDGEGMDADTLERAIEPFFTTKGIGKGTGLGLSMVDGMMRQWGGRMMLKSVLGKGTRVELWLPVATDQVAPAEHAQPPASIPETQGELRILVVDDDPLVLLGTSAMLEDLGHAVLEAHSAQQALDILDADEVGIVISDHAMPRMTGLELANEVRKRWSHLPFILATGYAELAADEGSIQYKLAKPFTQDELRKAIAEAMASQGNRAEALTA